MADRLTNDEVKHWQGRLGVAASVLEKKVKKYKQSLDRYSNRNLPVPGEGQATDDFVRVNMLFSNIKTKLPNLIFRNPDVQAIPRFAEANSIQKLLAEGTISYYMDEWKFHREARAAVLDCLLFGYGNLWTGYDIRTIDNTKPVERGDQSETARHKGKLPKERKSEKQTSTDFNPPQVASEGPTCFRISPKTLLTHPDAKLPLDKGARWIAKLYTPTILELRYDNRFPMDWRRKLKPSAVLDSARVPMKNFDPMTTKDPDMMYVGIFEVWDRLTRKRYWFADGENWELGSAMIKDWPFHGMEGYPVETLVLGELPDEFEGLAEIDPIINQLEELDKMRTYQLRHLKKVSNRTYVKTTNFEEGTDDDLRRGADGTVLTTHADTAHNQISLVQDAALSRDFYAGEESVKVDINQVSAIAEFDRSGVTGAKSATEASIIETANRIRADDAAQLVSDFALDTLKKSFQIMQQMLPPDLSIKINGPTMGTQWVRVTKEQIAGEYQLKITPGSTALPNRDVLRGHALRLYEIWAQSPWVDQRELHLMIGENFPELMAGGRLNRLIKDPEEAAREMQRLMEAQQGGEGAPPETNGAEVAAPELPVG